MTLSAGVFYLLLVQLAAAMEVNRDEAERCIDIATAALTNDEPKKAQKFLEKAQKLYPTEKAQGKMAEHPQHHPQHHLHPG